ncbi:bifunctional protein-serine/threonine kinase/phosphatase [Cocleimonas sp. KMM 6892]|uniref:bifunctional protein-serine/threonine kinase/phosphatase n=1 Tax=unclassified Cocleimonas TaxID=2639732 RepID=UPI002DBA2FEE|nr:MULTISPECIES: bifunctional protein-serine/threonine kinase/phosphatase [unclassified Cocleimonas]MEB8431397.1 bifunctional protein-serine/threonine kinase/phosphatase [Cocleimonas sp. KMM 6892]MEC4713831.1 bifunctional protein-serine/threonine kinase/phosphatase [Cocleimonas sp. KMM 6895]MEC4743162.1 bifunctional protein-serine/threonine kinase/phosphatase [Cocleimonas sp. KMM 6896]
MKKTLSIKSGQYSDKGLKEVNQDYCGIETPEVPQLDSKGIVIALADGISSSNVSQEASQAAIEGFVSDYYSTSDAWSVKRSGLTVLNAINSWLYSQTRQSEFRYNFNKGYVCTFSGIVIKSSTAHLFHVGDSRIYRLQNDSGLEVLTQEHRVNVSSKESYLKSALGMNQQLDLDYSRFDLEEGDTFLLMTDGIFEFISDQEMAELCKTYKDDLQQAAEKIAEKALGNGSDDNISIQIVCVDSLPEKEASEVIKEAAQLPFPPQLQARMRFDGYTIISKLYTSARSHVFRAVDDETQEQVVIKAPSVELSDDSDHLERLLLEEWIARRINSAHVLKPTKQTRKRHFFYIVLEYIEGQTLAQWMIDNPKPPVETVRNIIEQIAQGLRAFHRLDMLHQDIRPENIMIDTTGTVKIIDFGSTSVAGIDEMKSADEEHAILGTAQFTAPEYFLGEFPTAKADQFSLAVIAYQMLSGKLPYGTQVAKARSRSAQRRLHYKSVIGDDTDIPLWIDFTLRRALNPDPLKRYDVLSEFVYDLRHPNKNFINQTKPPLMQRNPTVFWQSVAAIQLVIIIALLAFK